MNQYIKIGFSMKGSPSRVGMSHSLFSCISTTAWAYSVFTLFGILFFFVGLQMLAVGVIGEYIGRIYLEVRQRSRYRIQEILTKENSRTDK